MMNNLHVSYSILKPSGIGERLWMEDLFCIEISFHTISPINLYIWLFSYIHNINIITTGIFLVEKTNKITIYNNIDVIATYPYIDFTIWLRRMMTQSTSSIDSGIDVGNGENQIYVGFRFDEKSFAVFLNKLNLQRCEAVKQLCPIFPWKEKMLEEVFSIYRN